MMSAENSQKLVDLAWELHGVANQLDRIGNEISGESGLLVPSCVTRELEEMREKEKANVTTNTEDR
jgi:rRNA-processing protein FCF1